MGIRRSRGAVPGLGSMDYVLLDRTSPRAVLSPNVVNDEFAGVAVDTAKWTRVANGSGPYGTWKQGYGITSFVQTADAATELDAWWQADSVSIGDYLETAVRIAQNGTYIGAFIGFANGTTFGTSNAAGTFVHYTASANTMYWRIMANSWPGMNTRAVDSTIRDLAHYGYDWLFIRYKYEAANTFGLYYSFDGMNWVPVTTSHSVTLTPTHIGFGVSWLNSTDTSGSFVTHAYFRKNPPDTVLGAFGP